MPVKVNFVLAALALAAACRNQPAPSSPAPAAVAPIAAATFAAPEAPAAGEVIRGKVTEKIDVASYSYLKVSGADGEVWTAVPTTTKGVGDVVAVSGAMWMENFKSGTLKRTWPKIAFGVLQGEPAPAAPRAAPTGSGGGMFAAAAAQSPQSPSTAVPAGHPAPAATADTGPVKVSKAAGPQGRTIADIYAQSAQLKDRPISVHGKVVKATNGVMGKNWLHLRDGTGAGATADLTVASDQTAGVGDTVLVSGIVHLDRSLGAGYHYDVLVEDAQVKGD